MRDIGHWSGTHGRSLCGLKEPRGWKQKRNGGGYRCLRCERFLQVRYGQPEARIAANIHIPPIAPQGTPLSQRAKARRSPLPDEHELRGDSGQ